MCNECAINRREVERTKIPKSFVFRWKGMVRPGGFELPTFWFVDRRQSPAFWLTNFNRLLRINILQ